MEMSGPGPGRVVVANPSSNPETIHAAEALASAGLLRRYHVPLATTPRDWEHAGRLLPGRLGAAAARELKRRALPTEIPPSLVQSTATLSDLRRVISHRFHRTAEGAVKHVYRHRANFDRAVARRLRPDDAVLFAIAGNASRSAQRANQLGITTLLDCAIGHHRHVDEMIRKEFQLHPEWASTMPRNLFPPEVLEAQDRELQAADRLLVLSSYAKNTFLERGIPEEKMVTTPLGVDLSLFHPRWRPDDGIFRVIFVGQLTQRKGLSYLVEGFRKAAIPGSELLLVGQQIGTQQPWGETPGVRHAPPVPRAELPNLYRLGDVYVLPSLAEGFPLTALEAMASGLPVIVSTHTFAEDVVTEGDDGFIIPVRDPDAIAERLRALADDPELRARMGAAGRHTAERFDWSSYGEQIVGLVQGLLDDHGGRSALGRSPAVSHPEL
jgi:starch synthase